MYPTTCERRKKAEIESKNSKCNYCSLSRHEIFKTVNIVNSETKQQALATKPSVQLLQR